MKQSWISVIIRLHTLDFSKRDKLITNKLMLQGYNESRLKFYGRYYDLVCDYKLPLTHMLDDLFHTIC
jgi:hypothetical protein